MAVEEQEERGSGLFANLTSTQRIVLIGSSALSLVLLIVVGIMMAQNTEDKYVTIFSRMSPKETGTVSERLKEERIPYEIRENGTAVAVDRSHQDEAKIKLAMSGLPKDGIVGFEIFDKSNFISTDFEKRVSLQRAVNGELSRLISQFEGVESARVNVVVPEPQLFTEQQLPTTAGVMVRFAPGGGFKPEQVEAITSLVASSVPGLSANNVTVVDTRGTVLTAGQGGQGDTTDRAFAKEMAKQMEIQNEVAAKLEGKVTALLERVVGPGKVQVNITPEMDFSRQQIRERNMTPVLADNPSGGDPRQVPLPAARREITEKTSNSTGPNNANAPGTDTNTQPGGPTYSTAATATGATNSSERTNVQETNAFNNKEILTTTSAGSIKRLTAAVLIQGWPAGKARDAEDIVKAAIGFSQDRGDLVTVKEHKFNTELYDTLTKELKKAEDANRIPWGWIGGIVLALLIGAGISGAVFGRRKPQAAGQEQFGALSATISQYSAIPPTAGAPGALPGGGAEPVPGAALPQDRVEVTRATVAVVPENPFGFLYGVTPQTVAQLLSSERLPTLVAVLAQLDPNQAENVISLLNPEIQNEVRTRLATNPVLPPMTQKMVSQSLRKRLQAIAPGTVG